MAPREKDEKRESGTIRIVKAPEPLADELSQMRIRKMIQSADAKTRLKGFDEAEKNPDISLLSPMLKVIFDPNTNYDIEDLIIPFNAIVAAHPNHPDVLGLAPEIARNFNGKCDQQAFLLFSHLADLNPGMFTHYASAVLAVSNRAADALNALPESSGAEGKVDIFFVAMDQEGILYAAMDCLGSLRCASALPHLRELASWAKEDPEMLEVIEGSIAKIESFNKS